MTFKFIRFKEFHRSYLLYYFMFLAIVIVVKTYNIVNVVVVVIFRNCLIFMIINREFRRKRDMDRLKESERTDEKFHRFYIFIKT